MSYGIDCEIVWTFSCNAFLTFKLIFLFKINYFRKKLLLFKDNMVRSLDSASVKSDESCLIER